MLEFKEIELNDALKIQKLTYNNEILACEKTAVNLIIWQKKLLKILI